MDYRTASDKVTKDCEHNFCELSQSHCCSCLDQRVQSDRYYKYVDGKGIVLEGKRWSGYCVGCQAVYEECEESVSDDRDSDLETEEDDDKEDDDDQDDDEEDDEDEDDDEEDDDGEDMSGSEENDGYYSDEYEDFEEEEEYDDSDSESDASVDSHEEDIPEPLSKEELMIANECKICFSQHSEVLLLPCAHLVLCKVLHHLVFLCNV
jgi:hypothetical protein